MLPGVVVGQQGNPSSRQTSQLHLNLPPEKGNKSVNIQMKEPKSLSFGDQDSWLDTSRSSFVTQRIRELVRAFANRAQKVKERITRAPTPSPSAPHSKDDTETISRPTLESLIQPEEDISEMHDGYPNSKARRRWMPRFPRILDPQRKLYISWLFFVMVSYVYNAWVIILRAVFPYQTPDNLPIFLAFDYIADLIYVTDIALFKVRLQYLHDGFWVDDPEKTRKHYFKKTMFKMDVLSLLPLDLLYFIYGTNPLFRLPRILKIQTFWEFFDRVDAVAKTPYVIRIIRTLLYMMYLIHLNACAYYAMSTWEGIASNKWVFQGNGNAYIRCFYFATKTATSIGKNPRPENEYEYVFMTVSWLMGVFIFAFLIGQIRDIVATATQSKTQYRQLMDQTVMYMRNLNLPEDLQRRVRLWLNHTWEQQKTLNEGGILDSLPRKMKTDVAINVHYNTLVKVQLFKDCDKALLRDLVLQLKPVLFLPGDYICRKGEVGKEMYIVNKGLVQVVASSENGDVVLATLSEGSVFGEISLLGIAGCSRRTADVRSQGFSNLFVLSKDDLWEALKNYPEAQEVLKIKARSLIKQNEARDRASKNNNNVKIEPTPIIKHNVPRPSTPRLFKTVMKVVPKDSVCSQLLERKPSMKKSIHPFKTNKDTPESKQGESNYSSFNKILPQRKTSDTMSRTSSSPQISEKDRSITRERSLSATTLRFPSPPRSYGDVLSSFRNLEDETALMSPASKVDSLLNNDLQHKKTTEDSKDLLKSILSLIPKDFHCKKQNVVHPAVEECNVIVDNAKPDNPTNTCSEDSGISVDLKTQNSINYQQAPTEKQEDRFSGGESDDSELSITSIKTTAGGENVNGTRNKGDLGYHTWVTPSSSVFSLQSLFRTNSSKSSSPSEKNPSVEHISQQDRKESYRPSSSASDISSAGYDNLAFVPVDILSSRRSSVFSDDVSC